MKVISSRDIFQLPQGKQDAVCINTNGMTRKDGSAVMGAGQAREAAERFFHIQQTLGHCLLAHGNHVYHMGSHFDEKSGHAMTVFTFPTKNDWRSPSDLALIAQSARELVDFVDRLHIEHCYLAAPGCGLGGLDWENQVKPVLSAILDDRFTVTVPLNKRY